MGEMFKSPVGLLRFPRLLVPHSFKGDDQPKYETTLRVYDEEDALPFVTAIDGWREEAAKQNGCTFDPTPAVTVEVDEQGREFWDFRFRVRATVQKRDGTTWDRRPAVFYSDGSPLPASVQMGNGTEAQVAFTPYRWAAGGRAGVTLQPVACCVHKLVEYGAGGPDEPEAVEEQARELLMGTSGHVADHVEEVGSTPGANGSASDF